ncbi:ShlB/FhaC/HecB family hemolysin secretion/activation protein [Labrenzia aggregata]|uniref:ShlB/FhaC/HecB family hemolysin secretion/activation protein n=2 Tax=Roseibium aggregatum TaxID=187304 RepID=A0A939J2A3_9HYPH|nr:ShlB/FhaC/HecB family hemolysin secretion/activation protein [Roseibium aggregatum]
MTHIPVLLPLAAGLLAAAGGPASAQTASQITRESYAPPVRGTAGGGLILPQAGGPDIPAGAAELHVTPSGLEVSGGFAELEGETRDIEAEIAGRQVTAAGLFKAADRLEAAYARAGYLLVRVSLPPQTIENGAPLRLVVTDGYLSGVDAAALPSRVQRQVKAFVAPLVGKRHLTRGELERQLLLAGDTPGLMLRSTLAAGDAPGATVLVLSGRQDPVTANVSIDNSMSEELGTVSMGLGVNFNSVLGFGETGYLHLGGYPGFNGDLLSDDPRNRQAVAGVTVPLGTSGAWINLEGVDSRTHPTSDLDFVLKDVYQRLSAKFGYAWIRSRSFNSSSIAGFDIANEDQTLVFGAADYDFASDRLRVLRVSQTADGVTPWGASVSGRLAASFGLDGLGARTPTAALPGTRFGAEPSFQKLEANFGYAQGLAGNRLQLSVSAKAQTSFGETLFASEQFGLGGADWLSAYESGGFEGDAGAAVRGELSLPKVLRLPGLTSDFGAVAAPYAFAAAGVSSLENPTALEEAITRAVSFGGGVRVALSRKASPLGANLKLEYARGAASGETPEDRFNLGFVARF